MGMITEFKEFAVRGNVVDMGVGIVIGAAFTSIVNSFVADILNPVLGLVTGGIDFASLFINLSGTEYETLAAAEDAGAATLNYGLFINAIISFVLFLVIKQINRLKADEETPAEPPAPPRFEVLLEEIRDLLAKQR